MLHHISFAREGTRHFSRFFLAGLALFAALLVWVWFFFGAHVFVGRQQLLAVPWPSTLSFADEPVPLTDFYIRENWEREFLIALDQDYQTILELKRAPKYFPFIEAALKARGMPDDLKYLAVAESGLREDSRSTAGAVGVWQFVPATARAYGLRVDNEIDERLHFEKSTRAALDYLTFLRAKFGSYTLAAAAYNVGENGLARAMEAQGVPSYYDLYLNNETSRYLFRILAAKQILAEPEEYGFELSSGDYFGWPDSEIIMAGVVDDLAAWAREHGTTLRAVKELNPWIVGTTLPAGSWEVRVERE